MEEKAILTPEWKELVKVASEWEYGSKHTHKEIAEIMGLEYGSTEYYSNVNRACEELAELGRRMRCLYNYGYYVLMPSEYPEAAYLDTKKSGWVLQKGINKINNAPVSKMDDNTKRRVESISNYMGKTLSSLNAATTYVHELAQIHRKQKMLESASKGKD